MSYGEPDQSWWRAGLPPGRPESIDVDRLLPNGGPLISLGEGDTPLLRHERAGDGIEAWLKLETANPTGSYKDRMNAVAATVARENGARALVASSTGNHGVAVAAYAAAAGLGSVVLFPEEVPDGAVDEALAYHALVMRMPWELRREVLAELLVEPSVWLSNRNDPLPWGNPFGLEGYKAIAYEIVRDLDGRAPRAVVVPTCGADGLYGIWKGFEELRRAGVTTTSPAMVAVQPAIGAPLVTTLEDDPAGDEVRPVPLRVSRALSLTDTRSGRLGLAAVRDSGGFGLTLTEAEIGEAVATLGRQGLHVDPASACGVAVFAQLAERGVSGEVVSIVTGRGARWPTPREPEGRFFEPSCVKDAIELSFDWLGGVGIG